MRMSRRISLIMIGIVLAFVTLQMPARAQTSARTGLAVLVNNYETKEAYIAVVLPDGTTSSKITFDPNVYVTMSPDGKWLAEQTSATDTLPETLKYHQINGQPAEVPVAKGYTVPQILFTNDGKYLLYTLIEANLANGSAHWGLGIITLDGGKRVEFNEPFLPKSSLGKGLVAGPLFFDGKHVILRAFVPFADGNFGGLFLLPIPDLARTASGIYPMPKSKQFLQATNGINETLASPDGTKIAYIFGDQSNPPTNYQSEGPQFFLNTIAMLDVAPGKSPVISR